MYKEPPPSANKGGGGGASAAAAVAAPRVSSAAQHSTAPRTSIRQPASGWVSSVSQSVFLEVTLSRMLHSVS